MSGSCSSGVAPVKIWRGELRRIDGSNLLQMAAVDKLEETIMDLYREYRINAFARQLHEQLINPAWPPQQFLKRLLVCLEAERTVR